MLMLRRNEKDFLARKNLKYRDKFIKNYNALDSRVDLLIDSLDKNGLDMDIAKTKELKSIIKEYKSKYLQIVTTQQKIGLHHNDGLYGSLRGSVHQAQDLAKKSNFPDALALTYELRKHEKDFMLRLDKKYITKFDKSYNKLISLINSSSTIYTINQKSSNIDSLERYKKDLLALVAEEEKKGFDSKSGLMGEMRKTIHKSEIVIKELTANIDLHINDKISATISTLILAIVSVLISIFTVSYLVSNQIIHQLKLFYESIKSSSDEIISISSNVETNASELSKSANNQAATVEEVSATVEELTANTKENSNSANQADILGQDITESAKTGYEQVKELTNSMSNITDASNQISNIIKTIDEIAFQTNLLALNAAVEAARAGEHGLGFAVVAEEVRSLANRSSEAARETSTIIENAIEEVVDGNKITSSVNSAFNEILDKINNNLTVVKDISVSSYEQSQGMEQINISMADVDSSTQHIASSSESLADSSNKLNSLIGSMNKTILSLKNLLGAH
jgi:methyl-accepting chemotaxis protein